MAEKLAIEGGTPVRTEPFDGPTHYFGDEDIEALTRIVKSGHIDKGPETDQFEREFAERYGVEYAISVTSGTAAMHTCVGAINPDPGDEIIVTPWTSGGSIIGMLLHNIVPVFADIDDTYCLDPTDVQRKITPRTRAIMVVNLMGNMGDIRALREIADKNGVFLIEDCCQSHFAEDNGIVAGTHSDISGVSFGGKHLSIGGGGMVLTNNRSLWERAILFRDAALPRDNGPAEGLPYANYFLAPNYKTNDLIAAVGRVQLRKVDAYVDAKIAAAEAIIDGLSDIPEIVPQKVRPGVRHTYWLLGVTLDTYALHCNADEFADAVSAEGIPLTGPYLGTPEHGPLYKNPFLAEPDMYGHSRFPFDYKRERPIDYRQVKCANGEELMSRNINFSMLPSFTEEYIVDVIKSYRKIALAFRERKG